MPSAVRPSRPTRRVVMIPRVAATLQALSSEKFKKNHPEKLLSWGHKPHQRFVEKFRRDFMIDGVLIFYEIVEIRLESDTILSVGGISRDVQDHLKAMTHDDRAKITTVFDALRRIDAMWQTAERIGVIQFTEAEGPLRFMNELQEHCDRNPGIANLVAADRNVRREFSVVQREDPSKFKDLGAAIREVLDNRKHLWSQSIHEVITDSIESMRSSLPHPKVYSAPGTPTTGGQLPAINSPTKRKNKGARKRDALSKVGGKPGGGQGHGGSGGAGGGGGKVAVSKGGSFNKGKGKGGSKGGKDGGKGARPKMPQDEWVKLMAISNMRNNEKICRFWNSSVGCIWGDQCVDKHECLSCPGQKHKYSLQH